MYKKIVGILVMMLLISSAISAVGNINEEKKSSSYRMADDTLDIQKSSQGIVNVGKGGMFFQLPFSPYESGYYEFSSAPDWSIFEDFWEIPNPICDIHWWGEYLREDNGVWYWLDPENMRVNITFYEDDNGQPGDLVASYIDVKPSVTETGLWYYWGDPFLWQLYYFEYTLDPCVNLAEGWVSVSSVANSDDGVLMWITSPEGNGLFLRNESGILVSYPHDVSLVLTDGEPNTSDLECEGGIRKTEVPPGSNVTGSFQVRNNGDVGSILHWKIDESTIPSWGANWTFTPNASILTNDMGWITVDVEFEAPNDKNKEFNQTLIIVNAADSSDYCEIDVYIKTPRTRATYNPLLLRFFDRFPNAFQILRQLLGL